MARPAGHVPPIPRWSADIASIPGRIVTLFVGVQGSPDNRQARNDFEEFIGLSTSLRSAPLYWDRAGFVDHAGFANYMVAMYWQTSEAYDAWCETPEITRWRARNTVALDFGWWWEPIRTTADRLETIAFMEFLRGVSACPFSNLIPTMSSGYWGAARDRIPASANSRFDASSDRLTALTDVPHSMGHRLSIVPPPGLAVIRSGVSWRDCGNEQRESYEKNIRPKLDAGMKYLVERPLESSCASLRQVVGQDHKGEAMDEGYSLGAFLSLGHLEDWAKNHPTHLAIYHRAIMERKKYQENLELRTYHEIYVLDDQALDFEYVNCHPATGLIRFFAATKNELLAADL